MMSFYNCNNTIQLDIVRCRIGTSEKGQLFLELSVTAPPGHSSMPLPESTIGILAKAVSR